MRFEIVLFLAAAAIMGNIYTDGKWLKHALSYKKYYQMAGVAFGAIMLYILLKKHPDRARDLVFTSNEYLKYMPVDRTTSSILNPILDFTSKYGNAAAVGGVGDALFGEANPILNLGGRGFGNSRQSAAEYKIRQSGGVSDLGGSNTTGIKPTKRSVSETKKKYVAAQQGWKCGHCNKQLPAWFEVDHKIRLEHGGSNHIDNLVALCRDCHGEKTALENL